MADVTEVPKVDPSPTTSMIASAQFSTFEDLSRRLVLVPANDGDCSGAKVCSHEVLNGSFATDHAEQVENTAIVDQTDDNKNIESVSITSAEVAPSMIEETIGNNTDQKRQVCDKTDDFDTTNSINLFERLNSSEIHESGSSADIHTTSVKEGEDVASDNSENRGKCNEEKGITAPKAILSSEQTVPEGYVLAKLTGKTDCIEHTVEELDDRDFTKILSLLRDAAYPITLEFVSPESLNQPKEKSDEYGNSLQERNSATDSDLQGDEETQTEAASQLNNHSVIASREEAAKYAAQAASELRGRLSRWGFQAATKAVEAAQAVQDIREERQKKFAEEQSKDYSSGDESISNDVWVENAISNLASGNRDMVVSRPCHLFLQTASGFVRLDNTTISEVSPASNCDAAEKQSTLITNMSIITVRFSEEKACPIGKDRFNVQWYRSKHDYTKVKEFSSIEWCKLKGASFAAYQPSVSDVGYLLSCVVGFNEDVKSYHRLISPLCITAEQTLFESAMSSILKTGSKNCATFSSFKDTSGNVFRIKIFVETNVATACVVSSSILIDQATDGTFVSLYKRSLPLIDIKVQSDPAKPRGFEIEFPSTPDTVLSKTLQSCNFRLNLDAPSRNIRESFLVSIGLARYTDKLSSLSANTTLLPNYVEASSTDSEEKYQALTVGTKFLSPDIDSQRDVSKSLYAIQLEAQNKELQGELETKTTLINKLQQRLIACNEDKKHTERELMRTRSKGDELIKCEQELKDKDKWINDQNRTITSLNNEKAVLSASIEMRDRKLSTLHEQIYELQTKLTEALGQVEEVRKHEADQASAKFEAEKAKIDVEANAIISEIKKEADRVKEELKVAQSNNEELNQKYASTKVSEVKLNDKLEMMRCEAKRLKIERNDLKNKYDSLSKEVSKLTNKRVISPQRNSNEAEIRTLTQTITQLQSHIFQLQTEVTSLRSEKRDVQEELQVTRTAHEQSAKYIADRQTPNRDVQRVKQQCEELESVVSNMTEHLDAKEMQISTLKQINKALLKEIDGFKVNGK